MTKRKVGIIGGAFDPVTIGHVDLAKFVLNSEVGIDEIWLQPCHSHACKNIQTSTEHRLNMCHHASRDENQIIVSYYEYCYEIGGGTLNFLNHISNNPDYLGYEFYFVIGMDNANEFHKWIKYDELLQKAKFIVVPRKGCDRQVNVNWYLNSPHIFLDKPNDIPNISSTQIREEIRILKELEDSSDIYDNEAYAMLETSLIDNIGSDVLDYIRQNKIY